VGGEAPPGGGGDAPARRSVFSSPVT